MPLWTDGFAEDAREVAVAGNQFHDLVTGLDPGELQGLGRLAIRIALAVFGGSPRVGNRGTDVGRNLLGRIAAESSEDGGGTTSGEQSIAKHGFFFLVVSGGGAVCPNSPELLHLATAMGADSR